MGRAGDSRHGERGRTKKRFRAVHLALRGRGPAPDEWLLAELCEEFHALPSQIVAEPLELLIKIRQIRQYVRVFQAADQATSDQAAPSGPLADLYYAIEDELHLESLRATVRQLRRKRAPKREIDKAQARVTKFETSMRAARARSAARGGR